MLIKPEVKAFNLDELSEERFENTEPIVIEEASILDMRISKPQADEKYALIANITWLCISKQNLFTLSTNYASVKISEADQKFIMDIPFLSFKPFKNFVVTNNMISNVFQRFITDMKIKYDNTDDLSKTKFSIYGVDITNTNITYDENLKEEDKFRVAKFELTPEVYSLFKFIDSYMTTGVSNKAELEKASECAVMSEESTKIVDASGVKVIKLLKPEKIYKNTIVALLEVLVGDNGEEKYNLLMDFDYTTLFKDKQFKNCELLSDYMQEYQKESNEYIYTFSFTDTIKEDSYIIAFGYNNNYDNALFAFNQSSIDSIISQISEMI